MATSAAPLYGRRWYDYHRHHDFELHTAPKMTPLQIITVNTVGVHMVCRYPTETGFGFDGFRSLYKIYFSNRLRTLEKYLHKTHTHTQVQSTLYLNSRNMQFDVFQPQWFLPPNMDMRSTQYVTVNVQLAQIIQKSDTFLSNSNIRSYTLMHSICKFKPLLQNRWNLPRTRFCQTVQ